MNFANFLVLVLIMTTPAAAIGQTANDFVTSKINTPLEPYLLRDVKYFSKNDINLDEFKGKWLVLDFWNDGCISCIVSFPRINAMATHFFNVVQFILIGDIGHGSSFNASQVLYEKCRQRYNLNLPVVYDSILFKRFHGGACPFIIIINPNGIIKAFTNHLTEEDMNSFLSGNSPRLEDATFDLESSLTPISGSTSQGFLPFANGATDKDILYGSLLSKWKSGMPSNSESTLYDHVKTKQPVYKFELLQTTAPELYRFAFFGKGNWFDPRDSEYYGKCKFEPTLELSDSSIFQPPNAVTGCNYFSYSLIIPSVEANPFHLMNMVQSDLAKFFRNKAAIELRMMPYLKLVASRAARNNLKTKGIPFFSEQERYMNWMGAKHIEPIGRHQGFIAKNIPVEWLIIAISGASEIELGGLPILDETGIQGNIDITVDALIFDLNEVKKALRKNGLDLVEAQKAMKVIVIKN